MNKLLLLALVVFSFFSCQKKISTNDNYMVPIHGFSMSTSYNIKLILSRSDKVEVKPHELRAGIEKRLLAVNNAMSVFTTNSEISLLNNNESLENIAVSEELFSVFKSAIGISKSTDGIYDITIKPLVDLWGFGVDVRGKGLPSDNEIENRLKNVGYKFLVLSESDTAVRKLIPQLRCDLSSIAKGYGVDAVFSLLDEKGFEDFMIEIGGEIRAKGKNLYNEFWRIGISSPETMSRKVYKVVSLDNVSVATSGNYENFFEKDGKKYNHIISPKTGMPVFHNLASVSIVDDDCATADGLATAVLAMGETAGWKLVKDKDIAALFIIRKDDGSFRERISAGFQKYISD